VEIDAESGLIGHALTHTMTSKLPKTSRSELTSDPGMLACAKIVHPLHVQCATLNEHFLNFKLYITVSLIFVFKQKGTPSAFFYDDLDPS
jgi:hypothetical protein